MNPYQKRKKAIEEQLRSEAADYKAILDKARKEERQPTQEERDEIAEHVKAIDVLEKELDEVNANIETLERVKETERKLSGPNGVELGEDGLRSVEVKQAPPQVKSIGEAFVEFDGYKRIQDPSNRAGQWTSGALEVPFQTKGTLLEGTGAPGSGTGGGLVPSPQVVPGVVDTLFQRNVFANLLGSGQVDPSTNTVRYTVEGTATSGAAGVAEGAAKPESTLGLSTKDESLKKLATFLPVSEETLEDGAQVQSYINGRLSLFLANLEDQQLIRGGGGNDLQGIIGRSGVNIYGGGTAAGNKAEQIFKAINGVRGSAFTEPEWVVLNPSDYLDLRLLKDANNQYFGGGPWMGQYGVGGQVAPNTQVMGGPESLWGKPLYVTANIGAGTALAGNSQDAIVWRKGGIRVDASNSHQDYFQKNLVAIRAEERLALAVYRPASFVEIRLA